MKIKYLINNPYVICFIDERIHGRDKQFKGKAKCNTWVQNIYAPIPDEVDPTPELRNEFDEDTGKAIAYKRALIKLKNYEAKQYYMKIQWKQDLIDELDRSMDVIKKKADNIVSLIEKEEQELYNLTHK